MPKLSQLPDAPSVDPDDRFVVMQPTGLHKALVADVVEAGLEGRGIVGAGTVAQREAYTYRKGGTPAVSANDIWLRTEGGQIRMEVWKAVGDIGPDGSPVADAGWKQYKTQAEMDNLSIPKTGILAKESVESLVGALSAIDEAASIRISNASARAITGGANPVVEVDASLTGVAPDSLSVSWSGFKVAIDKLPWRTKDQAALKDFFVPGNSIDDATDGPMWHTILAGRRGVTSRFTARYSSDQRQLYRAGLEPLILTIQGGTLPAGGTSVAITAINGNAPINVNAPYAFLSTGDAGLTTGVTMTGVIIDGENSRHGTAAAPNAGSAAYTFKQDAGQPALTLTGPVLFVPDIAKYPATSDNFCGIGQNIFYSGVPNFYGDHTNPEAYAIIDRFAAAADGNRFLIRDVLPDASWPGDGTPATPIGGVDYKNHQFAAMEAFNARNEQRHPGSRARTLPKPGYPNGMTLLQYLQMRGDGSANDNADIAAGFVPRSLRKDSLHPNLAGQTAIADFFEEAMQAQALAPAVTADTFFTLSAVGTLPRTGEATSASDTVRFQIDAQSLLDARLDALESVSGAEFPREWADLNTGWEDALLDADDNIVEGIDRSARKWFFLLVRFAQSIDLLGNRVQGVGDPILSTDAVSLGHMLSRLLSYEGSLPTSWDGSNSGWADVLLDAGDNIVEGIDNTSVKRFFLEAAFAKFVDFANGARVSALTLAGGETIREDASYNRSGYREAALDSGDAIIFGLRSDLTPEWGGKGVQQLAIGETAVDTASSVIYSRKDASGFWQIWSKPKSTASVAVQLSKAGANNWAPRLSSDGNLVFYSTDRAGGPGALFVPLAGGIEHYVVSKPKSVFIGDSLTWGDGSTAGNSMPAQFQRLTGREVVNLGVSGQTSTQIAARLGAVPLQVSLAGNIPATTTPVAISNWYAPSRPTFTSAQVAPLNSANSSVARWLTGTILGVHGMLLKDASDGYTFVRDAAGPSVAVPANTPFIPDQFDYPDCTAVIRLGENNLGDPATIKLDTAAVVAWLTPLAKQFIVLPPPRQNVAGSWVGTNSYNSQQQLKADLAASYGPHFVDDEAMLIALPNPANAQDMIDVGNGAIPTRYRAPDRVHFNDTGYGTIASIVRTSFNSLNY